MNTAQGGTRRQRAEDGRIAALSVVTGGSEAHREGSGRRASLEKDTQAA